MVSFRMGNLWRDMDARAAEPAGRSLIARRDLMRFYSLMATVTSSLPTTPKEVTAIAQFLEKEVELRETGSAELIAAVVLAAATAVGAKGLQKLDPVQSMALMDLIQLSESPADAGQRFAAVRAR